MKRLAPVVALLFIFGCAGNKKQAEEAKAEPTPAPAASETPAATPVTPAPLSAKAAIKALGKNTVAGMLSFVEVDGGVRIEGEVAGFSPKTVHGFHIHEKGDCSAADGTSAGGHFNPGKKNHGAHDAVESHVGDLGNITADDKGVAKISITKAGATLADGEMSYIGRGVIVHANPDDFKTQPTGNAGGRIGCGVVEKN